ncbi:MAG: glycosyltransferase family 4 protein, partial [Solirubrobacterales bacterium]|nr:glycosyltransferase family 4 protein [Solirubrobacterales bacterium]
ASVLERLAELVDLTVLFCAASASRGMEWDLGRPLGFRNRVVGGLTIGRGSPDDTDYYLSPRILGEIVREGPDAIISSGYSAPTAYSAVAAAVRRCPMVIQSDGTSDSERGLNRLQRIARRILVPLAAGAVANSDRAAARFGQLGVRAERIFLAPHSTDMAPLWDVARRRSYGSDRRARILAVGRLIPRKGLDRLMSAVRLARDGGSDLELTIVGSGPEEANLRRLARELGLDDVSWRGFVQQADLPDVYAAADVFAFPTLSDPFGLVLLEAAATGLPPVASPYGGATADIVVDGQTGFERAPEDVEGWASALSSLANEPELREAMGRAVHDATLNRTPEAAAAGYAQAVQIASGLPTPANRSTGTS